MSNFITKDSETMLLINALADSICILTSNQYHVMVIRLQQLAERDPKRFIAEIDRLYEVTERLTGLVPRKGKENG